VPLSIASPPEFDAAPVLRWPDNVAGATPRLQRPRTIGIVACATLETYAIRPLLHSQVLATGVASHFGTLYFGVNNPDRAAICDVEELPTLLREVLDELLEAAQ
jgi:hypothetical protein